MNNAIVAAIIGALFLVIKMALKYKDPNTKQFIQDAVVVFISSMAGLYGVERYVGKPIGPKVAAVFTETPSF